MNRHVRIGPWTYAPALATLLLVALTYPRSLPFSPPGHHVLTLVLAAVILVMPGLRIMRTRAHWAWGAAVWNLLAAISGLLIILTKPHLKTLDIKDWANFWHVAWSWLGLGALIGHVAVNAHASYHILRKICSERRTAALFWSAIALSVAALTVIAGPFIGYMTRGNYLPQVFWLTFGTLLITTALWIRLRILSQPGVRVQARKGTDVALIFVGLAAHLSGLPLIFAKATFFDNGLKFVVKSWHTWPSMVMTVLLVAHAFHTWAQMRRHLPA